MTEQHAEFQRLADEFMAAVEVGDIKIAAEALTEFCKRNGGFWLLEKQGQIVTGVCWERASNF
jgi:hypothetical protein